MQAQLARRSALMASGARRLGWKAGFASKAAMERLGTSGPLFAFLLDTTVIESGATVNIKGWKRAVFEAEVAVHLGSNVRAYAGARETRAAIAGMGPAIELADLDPSISAVEDILAGGIFHRHVILGAVREGAGGEGFEAVIFRDDAEIARTTDPTPLTGDRVAVLQALAEVLEAGGEALKAGDVIIMGSVVPPIDVAPGQVLRAEMSPLGSVEVRFEEVSA